MLATCALMAAALAAGCGRDAGPACGSVEDVAAVLREPGGDVDSRRRAMACAADGAREELASARPCPLDGEQSWREAAAYVPIALGLADADAEVRSKAREAFELVVSCQRLKPVRQEEAESAFLHALESRDPDVQVDAMIGLRVVGDPAATTRVLVARLVDPVGAPGTRRAAAEVLTAVGDVGAVEALGGMIGRWDTQLQQAALTRLAQIGSPADTVFRAVATTLRDGPLPLQAAAATAAASMCRGAACAPEAAASIVASFARGAGGSTSYGDARYVALSYLGADALPAIEAALDDSQPGVRVAAAEAISAIWNRREFKPPYWPTNAGARDQDGTFRLFCSRPSAAARLLVRVTDADAGVRDAASWGFTRTSPALLACPATIDLVRRAASSPDKRVRDTAQRLLQQPV